MVSKFYICIWTISELKEYKEQTYLCLDYFMRAVEEKYAKRI